MKLLQMIEMAGLVPKKVSDTNGGEYHSACPRCGGQDRFFTQPYRKMQKCCGSYRCRQCGISGDTIQFARDFLNYSFQEAKQAVQDTDETWHDNVSKGIRYRTKQFRTKRVHKPHEEWIMQATALTSRAHRTLLNNPTTIDYLTHRGISIETIRTYKLGWLPETARPTRKSWGLQPKGNCPNLWIPAGIIIPCFDSDNVTRIKIRRWNAAQQKYVIVSGSMNGMQIIGNNDNPMLIVVESELDAFAIYSKVGDFAIAVATGGNQAYPDNVTDNLVRKMNILCVCHDNDKAGEEMLARWQQLYQNAIDGSLPTHKDIGEAIQGGVDIRSWFFGIYRNHI